VFVSQRWRRTFDQIEKAFTSRRDVSTALDIVGRLKSLSGLVVPLVEKRIECFEDSALFASSIVFVISGTPDFESGLEHAVKVRRLGQSVLAGIIS
jgi:hypothetical protein